MKLIGVKKIIKVSLLRREVGFCVVKHSATNSLLFFYVKHIFNMFFVVSGDSIPLQMGSLLVALHEINTVIYKRNRDNAQTLKNQTLIRQKQSQSCLKILNFE